MSRNVALIHMHEKRAKFEFFKVKSFRFSFEAENFNSFHRRQITKPGGLDVETNRDRDRDRP